MTNEQKVIRAKVGLLGLAKQLGSATQACKVMGNSRVIMNRVAEDVESVIREMAIDQPTWGQVR